MIFIKTGKTLLLMTKIGKHSKIYLTGILS